MQYRFEARNLVEIECNATNILFLMIKTNMKFIKVHNENNNNHHLRSNEFQFQSNHVEIIAPNTVNKTNRFTMQIQYPVIVEVQLACGKC